MLLLDATGYVRVSLWNSHADVAQSLKRGDIVKLENATVRAGLQEKPELSLGGRGRLLLNPQGIKVAEFPEVPEHQIKIDEIEADMPTVDLAAKVRRKFPSRDFRRSDGTAGKVMSLILSDETGVIRASFWGSSIDQAQGLRLGDILRIRNAYTRRGLGDRPEVHLGTGAKIEVNPAGVTVEEPQPSRMLLGELEPGMDAIEVIGRIMEVGEVREFERDGDRGKVATLTVGDSTGTARVSLWREMTDKLKELKAGDIVKLSNAYTTIGFLGGPEIQVGRDGVIEVNPKVEEELPAADVLTLAAERPTRVSVGELQREGMRVQVRGTLIRMFNVRPIFDICPTCGRSLGGGDTNPLCESCGKVVKPEHRLVLSFILDDGTGSIRCVVFGETAEKLLGVNTNEAFETFKSVAVMEEFYSKFALKGRELLLSGTTRRNRYFDQLELGANEIQFPDSRQEARLLLETIQEGIPPR
jgi:replication factor A1